MTSSCDRGSEPSDAMKDGELLDQLSDCLRLRFALRSSVRAPERLRLRAFGLQLHTEHYSDKLSAQGKPCRARPGQSSARGRAVMA